MIVRTSAIVLGCALGLAAGSISAANAQVLKKSPAVQAAPAPAPAPAQKAAAPAPKTTAPAKPSARAAKAPAAAKAAAADANALPPGVKPVAEPDAVKAKPKAKAKGKVASSKKSKGKGKKLAKAKGKDKGKNARVAARNYDPSQVATDLIENAGEKSPLELLASYKQTVKDGDLETAAVLLRVAANTDVTRPLVAQTNDMLGVALDTEDTEVLIQISTGPRAKAVAETVAPPTPAPPPATPNNARIQSAHALVAAAPRTGTIDYLGAYKFAVLANNPEAAAIALAGALRKPIDEASVIQANTLLELAGNVTANAVSGRSATIGPAEPAPTAEPAIHY